RACPGRWSAGSRDRAPGRTERAQGRHAAGGSHESAAVLVALGILTVEEATMAVSSSLVADLQRRLGFAPPRQVLATVLTEIFPNRVAVVSSFGGESAVLLHLVARIDATTPVIFVDTGRHFPETLDYRDRLVEHLGLKDLRSVGPSAADVAR